MSDSLQPHGLVHGILQARILEWIAFPFSSGSAQPRDRTQVSHTAGGFFPSFPKGSPGENKMQALPHADLMYPWSSPFPWLSLPPTLKDSSPRALYLPLPPNLLLQKDSDPYRVPYTLPLSWSLLFHHTDSLGSTVCFMCLHSVFVIWLPCWNVQMLRVKLSVCFECISSAIGIVLAKGSVGGQQEWLGADWGQKHLQGSSSWTCSSDEQGKCSLNESHQPPGLRSQPLTEAYGTW